MKEKTLIIEPIWGAPGRWIKEYISSPRRIGKSKGITMQDFTGYYGGLPLEKETIMFEELQYPNTDIVIKVGDILYSQYWDSTIEVTNIDRTAKLVETIAIENTDYNDMTLHDITEQEFVFKRRSDAQSKIVRLESIITELQAKINKRDDLLQQVWDWSLERDKGAHHIDIIKRQIAKLGERDGMKQTMRFELSKGCDDCVYRVNPQVHQCCENDVYLWLDPNDDEPYNGHDCEHYKWDGKE